ncbi:MAG: glycoside hydrolase family 127 protein [Muribaculaceae bacterium]|nr:glycoside hydrolase family 127 protein [Muribaculaceae bacterium]
MKKFVFSLICAAALPSAVKAQSLLYPQHFDAGEVVLSEGPLRTAMDRNINLLLQYDVDRLLTPFVRQSGLSDDPKSKYYGWTEKHPSFRNWGECDWSLEGHVGGHYLTALALAYPVCTDPSQKRQIKERLDYMLEVLDDCQRAFDGNREGLEGFIGGQPINQIWTGLYAGDLKPFKQYGGWVPFYCQHKVLAGLRDAWIYTGSERAEKLFRKMSDWSVDVIGNLTDEQVEDILGWEHGGMNETLADAYRLLGDERYLEAARRYSHKHEIRGMQGSEDGYSTTFLNGQHANTQVPKFIGFERIHQEAPEDSTYRVAAHNFWDDVARHRTVCIGGNSVSEHFLSADRCHEYMNNLDGPESCNSNNMLKLSENLFDETHDARYADFYEGTMWNHILSTQDPLTGGYVYFTSLRPQSYRIYSQVNQGMWCCVGTGMENHSKYGHFVYTHAPDDNTLYVNLFTPSELDSEKFGVKQQTHFPYESASQLTLTKGGHFKLAVRHPAWVGEGFGVKVNGREYPVNVERGTASYVEIERDWKEGDVVTISLPMELMVEECPNYPDYVAFKYGPILLAARTPDGEPLANEYGGEGRMDHSPAVRASAKPLLSAPLLIGDRADLLNRISVKDPERLLFAIDASNDLVDNGWVELTLEPFYGIHHDRYTCYWYQQTPEGFLNSDMARADAEAKALAERTIDFVATGEQQSEAGHEAAYSAGSTSGSHGGESYRDAPAGGYVEYRLANPEGAAEGLALMCRFTTDDRGRQAVISVDGTPIAEVSIPKYIDDTKKRGFYNAEYAIPGELLKGKESIVVKISSETTTTPGLYYLRLVK